MQSEVKSEPSRGRGVWNRVLFIILVPAILGALATLGYMIISPNAGEGFTEFYTLHPDSKTADYPIRS